MPDQGRRGREACLGEVDPLLEQRGLALPRAGLGRRHVELARHLRKQRRVAVVLALPALRHEGTQLLPFT